MKLLSVSTLTGLIVGVLGSAHWVPSAQAAYPCPGGPGADDVRVGTDRVLNVPMCEKKQNYGGSNSGSSAAPTPDPFKAKMDAASAVTSALQGNLAERERIMKSPKYQAYMNGEWEFSEAKNGEPCAAIFSRKGEIVMLSRQGGQSKGGYMTFLSSNIPRPASPETITVTLSQDKYKPQTVQTPNFTLPLTNSSLGAIRLTIPDLEATLTGEVSTSRYDLATDGKSVMNIEVQASSAIGDKLRKCLSARISQ